MDELNLNIGADFIAVTTLEIFEWNTIEPHGLWLLCISQCDLESQWYQVNTEIYHCSYGTTSYKAGDFADVTN